MSFFCPLHFILSPFVHIIFVFFPPQIIHRLLFLSRWYYYCTMYIWRRLYSLLSAVSHFSSFRRFNMLSRVVKLNAYFHHICIMKSSVVGCWFGGSVFFSSSYFLSLPLSLRSFSFFLFYPLPQQPSSYFAQCVFCLPSDITFRCNVKHIFRSCSSLSFWQC